MEIYIVPKVKFKGSCVKVEVVVQYMSLYIKYLPQSSSRCSEREKPSHLQSSRVVVAKTSH